MSSSPSTSKSARVEPAASSAAPYASARSSEVSQTAASSSPWAPPKETRTSAPPRVSASIRDVTRASSTSWTPSQAGVQSPSEAMTNARLYAVGEPAVSVPEAVEALT